MDPIEDITKAIAGVAVDKLIELVERDTTSEDSQNDPKLKALLKSKLPGDDVAVSVPLPAVGLRRN